MAENSEDHFLETMRAQFAKPRPVTHTTFDPKGRPRLETAQPAMSLPALAQPPAVAGPSPANGPAISQVPGTARGLYAAFGKKNNSDAAPPLNVAESSKYLRKNARSVKNLTQDCGGFVRRAMVAGGMDGMAQESLPAQAGHSLLPKYGFEPVVKNKGGLKDYAAQAGDIAVFKARDRISHPQGHIAMYTTDEKGKDGKWIAEHDHSATSRRFTGSAYNMADVAIYRKTAITGKVTDPTQIVSAKPAVSPEAADFAAQYAGEQPVLVASRKRRFGSRRRRNRHGHSHHHGNGHRPHHKHPYGNMRRHHAEADLDPAVAQPTVLADNSINPLANTQTSLPVPQANRLPGLAGPVV